MSETVWIAGDGRSNYPYARAAVVGRRSHPVGDQQLQRVRSEEDDGEGDEGEA